MNQQALEDLMENKKIRIHFQTEGEKRLWKEAFRPVHSKFSNQIGNQVLKEWQKLKK